MTAREGERPQVTARATVEDVARLAGVSTKTVSRVISGGPHVSPSTRAKVQEAAATLRFRANSVARELRSGGVSSTVAFVIGDLTNPFFAAVAAGVERTIARSGLTLVIAATDDESRQEPAVVAAMLERRVRALLLVPIAEDHAYLDGERQLGTPIVAVDRPLSTASSDSVVFDNHGGAMAGTLALLDAGHRRIGFVGSTSRLSTHRERRSGFLDAFAARGLTADPDLVRTDAPDVAAAEAATRGLLSGARPPTAIFAGNNRATIGALTAIRRNATTTGLIGFDDVELADALGLSVVAHDPELMGETAARLALDRLDDPGRALEQVVLPTRLVLRGSERSVR
ncbi:LacI family DNA-binding transcriptional regulator [Actinotalea sp.]|uniref:LacI family DNA-binding transcriptional regulator n=1 Tax=Actinotalea sp. TaxID=1872145 RepID=UPI003563C1A0